MGRRTGNDAWWREVEEEMRYYHLPMFEAERQLFARVIRAARAKGVKHEDVAEQMWVQWGITHGGYYRKLKQARATLMIR